VSLRPTEGFGTLLEHKARQLRSPETHCRAQCFNWNSGHQEYLLSHVTEWRGVMLHDHAAYIGVVGVFLLSQR
jgi:hypothetical protein